jgi:hypothetical protein
MIRKDKKYLRKPGQTGRIFNDKMCTSLYNIYTVKE